MGSENGQAMGRCWECEASTEHLVAIALYRRKGPVRSLLLCSTCHRTCYIPLSVNGFGALFVETQVRP
jgi:hypothetical protein